MFNSDLMALIVLGSVIVFGKLTIKLLQQLAGDE